MPVIKAVDISAGREALNPPNSRDPSIMAWGLNQVTAKQTPITFIQEPGSISAPAGAGGQERSRVMPIYRTARVPARSMVPLNTGKVSTRIPTPKKQARASETSKNMIMNAVCTAFFIVSRAAVFIK